MKILETKETEITIPLGVEIELEEGEVLYEEWHVGIFTVKPQWVRTPVWKFKIVKEESDEDFSTW